MRASEGSVATYESYLCVCVCIVFISVFVCERLCVLWYFGLYGLCNLCSYVTHMKVGKYYGNGRYSNARTPSHKQTTHTHTYEV